MLLEFDSGVVGGSEVVWLCLVVSVDRVDSSVPCQIPSNPFVVAQFPHNQTFPELPATSPQQKGTSNQITFPFFPIENDQNP